MGVTSSITNFQMVINDLTVKDVREEDHEVAFDLEGVLLHIALLTLLLLVTISTLPLLLLLTAISATSAAATILSNMDNTIIITSTSPQEIP